MLNMKMKRNDMMIRLLEVVADSKEKRYELDGLKARCDVELKAGSKHKKDSETLIASLKTIVYYNAYGHYAKLEMIDLFNRMIANITDIISLNKCLRILLKNAMAEQSTSLEKLQMAVDDCTSQGDDPNIYATIDKFFPNIDDGEVEAIYNYIADYTVSNETQATDEQIDLLYAKGYLVNDESTWDAQQTPETEIELSSEVEESWQKSTLEIEDVEDDAIQVSEMDCHPEIRTFIDNAIESINALIKSKANRSLKMESISAVMNVLEHNLEVLKSHEVFYADTRDTTDTPKNGCFSCFYEGDKEADICRMCVNRKRDE